MFSKLPTNGRLWKCNRLGQVFRAVGHEKSALASSPTVDDPRGLTECGWEDVKPFSEIPSAGGLPFFGTLFQYKRGPFSPDYYHLALKEKHKKYGKIFTENIAGRKRVHLFDPEYIRIMFGHDGKTPHVPPLMDSSQMYREYRELSPGLGNVNGDDWYKLRSSVQQMMVRPQSVTKYLPFVNTVADDFIREIHDLRDPNTGKVDNFRNMIYKWTLESAAFTCTETRLGSFKAGPDSFQQKMIDSSDLMMSLQLKIRFSIPWHRLVTTPTWKKLVEAEDLFNRFAQEMITTTCAEIQSLIDSGQMQEGQYSFLTYLLSRKELSFKDVVQMATALFADGLITTSPTTIGQLYCLATNPEAQDKLYQEIQQVAPDKDAPITEEHVSRLSYLKCCIKEGFRFFPISPEVSRIPQKDIVLGGYKIPAGTVVELNYNMLLREPEYFEDPESYIPERWVRGGSASNTHPFLMLPFSFGPRTCVGRRFAEQEMQVFLVKLIQNFRLEWHESYPIAQRYSILLTPNALPNFTFVPRN